MKKTQIILDCDTKNEIDDPFAIVYSLNSPEIDLLGVVSVQNNNVSGENSVSKYHNEAKKIMGLCNSKVPTFRGSKDPIKSKEDPEMSSGVEFIINTVMKSNKKIYVVGTGPCTDMVNACLIEPKIMKKVKFIWLGGFKNNDAAKKSNYSECNFNGDKLATKILMDLDIDLTLLPAFGVTSKLIRNCNGFREKLEGRNKKITNYLARLIKSTNKRIWTFWDLGAPAVAKGFGVIKKRKIPACKIINEKFYFPKNNNHNITLIESIDEMKILSQSEKYILK